MPRHHLTLQRLLGLLLELRALIALAIVAASIWAFVGIADEVSEGESAAFDRTIFLWFREGDALDPLGGAAVEEIMRDITALGGFTLISLMTLGTMGFLILSRKQGAALFVLAAVMGAMLLSYGLKIGFDRPRPDLVAHGAHVITPSFPSGHSSGAAATYLALGALLARFQPHRRLKLYIVSLAVLITVGVGISRIYLGVHWPTDVLAGWAVGSGWAVLCWLVALLLQREGAIEPTQETPHAEQARSS